jgi:hypothetical protein
MIEGSGSGSIHLTCGSGSGSGHRTPSENLYEFQNINLNFGTTMTLKLHSQSIFSRYQNYGVKNIFRENPVEVRSVDRIYQLPVVFHLCIVVSVRIRTQAYRIRNKKI